MISRRTVRRAPRANTRRVVLRRWSLRRLWRNRSGPRLPAWRMPRPEQRSAVARALRLTVVAAVLGLGLAAGLWYGVPSVFNGVKAHPYFELADVQVTGNRRLSRAEILEWVGIADGASVWDAAPNVIRTQLLGHPWVRRVSVQRRFPDRLRITIEERRPVALVQWQGWQYVDRYGRLLGPLRDGDSRDFPVITGVDPEAGRDVAVVGLHRALQLLRRCEQLAAFDGVSEIRVDPARGLVLHPVRVQLAVVLGWGSWREKLGRAARVLASWQGQPDRVALIDVSYRNQVVVKLRDSETEAPPRGTKGSGLRV